MLAVTHAIRDTWERVVINMEMEYDDEEKEPILDTACFYIKSTAEGDYEQVAHELDRETELLFEAPNDLSLDLNQERWGSCDLVIDCSGKYRFKFDFEKPKRLGGIFDEQSVYRFNNYLQHYKPGVLE